MPCGEDANDITNENEVAPAQVSAWKKELEERKGEKDRQLARKERREQTAGEEGGAAGHREGVPRKKVRGAADRPERKAMIELQHTNLSIRRQCELIGMNRNRLKSGATKTSAEDEAIMKDIDEIYTECPFLGQRKIVRELRDRGY